MQTAMNSLLEFEFAVMRNYMAMVNAATHLCLDGMNADSDSDCACHADHDSDRRCCGLDVRGAALDDHYGRRHTDVDVERL